MFSNKKPGKLPNISRNLWDFIVGSLHIDLAMLGFAFFIDATQQIRQKMDGVPSGKLT